MPLFTKPQFNSVWAATGTRLAPDNAKISQGWIVEIPPHEYENWSQNRQDALLAHINQVGVPMWDATVEYQAGKSYIQGTTTGVVYRAVTTNTNVNPELDIQGNWTVAFEATGQALLKANNLSDVPDKALARENLGIATTPFYDGRYLAKDSNLADVPNKSTARNNLGIPDTVFYDGRYLRTSQNLADVPDKAAARTNLGIPDTVFYDGRYLRTSQNLADVPNKATARNNLGLGDSSTRNVGTIAGTLAAGDDQRITWAVQSPRRIIAGDGLVGGGDLWVDRTISLGTPSPVTATSTNFVSGTTHSHSFDVSSFLPTTYVDVTGQRVSTGTYYNTTGKMMMVAVTSGSTNDQAALTVYVNSLLVMSNCADMISGVVGVSFIVPINASYRVDGSPGIQRWTETR